MIFRSDLNNRTTGFQHFHADRERCIDEKENPAMGRGLFEERLFVSL
jgi:hypothetical protein